MKEGSHSNSNLPTNYQHHRNKFQVISAPFPSNPGSLWSSQPLPPASLVPSFPPHGPTQQTFPIPVLTSMGTGFSTGEQLEYWSSIVNRAQCNSNPGTNTYHDIAQDPGNFGMQPIYVESPMNNFLQFSQINTTNLALPNSGINLAPSVSTQNGEMVNSCNSSYSIDFFPMHQQQQTFNNYLVTCIPSTFHQTSADCGISVANTETHPPPPPPLPPPPPEPVELPPLPPPTPKHSPSELHSYTQFNTDQFKLTSSHTASFQENKASEDISTNETPKCNPKLAAPPAPYIGPLPQTPFLTHKNVDQDHSNILRQFSSCNSPILQDLHFLIPDQSFLPQSNVHISKNQSRSTSIKANSSPKDTIEPNESSVKGNSSIFAANFLCQVSNASELKEGTNAHGDTSSLMLTEVCPMNNKPHAYLTRNVSLSIPAEDSNQNCILDVVNDVLCRDNTDISRVWKCNNQRDNAVSQHSIISNQNGTEILASKCGPETNRLEIGDSGSNLAKAEIPNDAISNSIDSSHQTEILSNDNQLNYSDYSISAIKQENGEEDYMGIDEDSHERDNFTDSDEEFQALHMGRSEAFRKYLACVSLSVSLPSSLLNLL